MVLDPETGARAIVATSILSPRTKWETLLDALGPWLHGDRETLPAFLGAVRRAESVMAGEAWIPDRRRSPKVHSFANALLGDTEAVTVDVWMLRALGLPVNEGLSLTRYEELVRDFRAAAALVGETPRELQAVLWIQARGVTEL